MNHRWLSALLVFGLLWLAPWAKADQWDERTVVTFNEPVEIPGMVLPAGTYVMKLANSPSDRDIVQFFNKDETKLLGTVMAIPDYREEPTGKTVINFEERAANSPEAIKSWFYPGDEYGVEFLYPKHPMSMTLASHQAQTRPQPQYTATPAPAPTQAKSAPAPTQATPAPQPPKQMAMANPAPAPPPAPAPAPAPQPQQQKTAPKELPKTASELPLMAMFAGIAMGVGMALRKLTA